MTTTTPDLATRKRRARAVLKLLRQEFPGTKCSLDHESAYQLLVAVILSAQCTDARVNQVTPQVFELFPTPDELAAAPLGEIEEAIRSTGFFRNKAKSLKGMAAALAGEHAGEMPGDIKTLVKLPGVGRKTANVILGEVFNKPDGVVVDTHVGRISRKLGLATEKDPAKVERELAECVPQKDWRDYGHLIIDHGRLTCKARAPNCDDCALYKHCEVRA